MGVGLGDCIGDAMSFFPNLKGAALETVLGI